MAVSREPIKNSAAPELPGLAASLSALAALGEAMPDCITVGLSGGKDSVALLFALHRLLKNPTFAPQVLKLRLRAAHIHHGLSRNADAWVVFCKAQCAALAIPLDVDHVNVETGPRISVEAAARTARYAALKRIADTCGANSVVALAHHADDQIESFLLQLLRGAGPRGLAAMPIHSPATATRPALWRPLLSTYATELQDYVRGNTLPHIEDDSNHDRRFKRNALRLDVLPALAAHFPSYRAGILRSISLQQETLGQINSATSQDAKANDLPIKVLRNVPAAQAAETLRAWLVANQLPLIPATRTREAVRQLQSLTTDQRFKLQLGTGKSLIVRNGVLMAQSETSETNETKT